MIDASTYTTKTVPIALLVMKLRRKTRERLELPENLKYELTERLARQGMTQQNVADVLGIHVTTFQTWLKEDKQLKAAWERGRLHPDHLVEQSLFRLAVGYQIEEFHEEMGPNDVVYKKKRIVKEVPPNPLSQFFWLKNRLPHLWQDKVQHELSFRDLMDLGNKHRDRNFQPRSEPLQIPCEVEEGVSSCGENMNDAAGTMEMAIQEGLPQSFE